MTATPEDWNELTSLSLEVRHADGTSEETVLNTEPVTGDLDVQIGAPIVNSTNARNDVTLEQFSAGSRTDQWAGSCRNSDKPGVSSHRERLLSPN